VDSRWPRRCPGQETVERAVDGLGPVSEISLEVKGLLMASAGARGSDRHGAFLGKVPEWRKCGLADCAHIPALFSCVCFPRQITLSGFA